MGTTKHVPTEVSMHCRFFCHSSQRANHKKQLHHSHSAHKSVSLQTCTCETHIFVPCRSTQSLIFSESTHALLWSRILAIAPHKKQLIPSSGCNQASLMIGEIKSNHKLLMMVPNTDHWVFRCRNIPQTNSHVIPAWCQNVFSMRREPHPSDGITETQKTHLIIWIDAHVESSNLASKYLTILKSCIETLYSFARRCQLDRATTTLWWCGYDQ